MIDQKKLLEILSWYADDAPKCVDMMNEFINEILIDERIKYNKIINKLTKNENYGTQKSNP